jgi:hypothetical protein
MFSQPTKRRMQYLLAAAAVLTLAVVFLGRVAFAKVVLNTIDPVATVTDNGHHLIVTGPIGCTESQRAYLRVTVTQRSTGAVAEGRTMITCTGATQQWEVHAATQGNEAFTEGPATVVASARTTDRGATDDAHQWLVNVTLVRE